MASKLCSSLKVSCTIAALLTLHCLASQADLESGELAQSNEKICGIYPVVIGFTDTFLTLAGFSTGITTSSVFLILATNGELDSLHYSVAKKSAQMAFLMLFLSAIPVFLIQDYYLFSYFFGIGLGAGEIMTGAIQTRILSTQDQAHRNALYTFIAPINLVLGVASMVTFSVFAAQSVMHNDYCESPV